MIVNPSRNGSFIRIGKFMQQKELAALLGISPAMVSRLVKRGMPTTLEGAQRWRKRHLEPGRIKGARFDPKRKATPTAPAPATPSPAEAALVSELLADIEAAGAELDKALTDGDQVWADVMIQQVRDLLRALPDGAWPALPIAVWDVLTAEIRALWPPNEGNPLCADGSPVYMDSMTAEEAQEVGQFWLEVAAGKWIVNKDYQPPAP
nr:hypothetical protein [Rhodoferax sp.]